MKKGGVAELDVPEAAPSPALRRGRAAAEGEACIGGKFTCDDRKAEKQGTKWEKLLTCPELLARKSIGEACVAARKLIQTECYAGSPDPAHEAETARQEDAVKECIDKAKERRCIP